MTMFKGRVHNIHFVGIGGIGMSGIAEVLLNLGYAVSGSDLRDSDTTRRLADLGGRIYTGHSEDNLEAADVVVISSAVKAHNPEVRAARSRSIPVIPRAEMLAELMRLKYGIAVAGSHGKTTTTSLLATLLDAGGLEPTVVVGGKVNSLGSNARLGQGDYLVAEADESDGSFLKLSPTIAVVTNIDPEHMDHYSGLEHLKETFLAFVNKIPFYGLSVLCLDCDNVQSLIPQVEKRYVTYGTTSQADYHLSDVRVEAGCVSFCPVRFGEVGERISLSMVGRHNMLNALASLAVADELGIARDKSRSALDGFSGVQRRFTIRGEIGGVMVVDDYGHHPTEIRATLAGARESLERRIIAVVQPHRYSRVKHLFDQFATACYDADIVIVTDIYPAGESPIEGVSGEALTSAMRTHGHRDASFCATREQLDVTLRERVEPGDVVITLGAGDIWQAGQALLDALKKRE